jgi:hypothetical protein
MHADDADTRRLVSAARFARAGLPYRNLLVLTRRRVQSPIRVHLRHQHASAFLLAFFLA